MTFFRINLTERTEGGVQMQPMEEIYQTYAQTVYRYLFSLTRDGDLAEPERGRVRAGEDPDQPHRLHGAPGDTAG